MKASIPFKWWALPLIGGIILLAGFSHAFQKRSPLISSTDKWQVEGNFIQTSGNHSSKNFLRSVEKGKDVILWKSGWTESWSPTGRLVSPVFSAPAFLSMLVSEQINASGNQLYLEKVETGERLALKAISMSHRWGEAQWKLSSDWIGQSVRVVAMDGISETGPYEGGKFGISSPMTSNGFAVLSFQLAQLKIVPIYLLHFFLLWFPWLFVSKRLVSRFQLHSAFTLPLGLVLIALTGYATFWGYFFNQSFGQSLSILLTLGSIGLAIYWKWKGRLRQEMSLLKDKDIQLPLLLMAGTGLFYLAYHFWIGGVGLGEGLAEVRYASMPPDNTIPLRFARKLYNGQDPRIVLGGWLSSDRPPLQTGLVLLHFPLSGLTGIGLHYQIFSTLLQCAWIPGLWVFSRVAKFSTKQIAILFAASIFSGFALSNSIFVWPKLLAAFFILLAIAFLYEQLTDHTKLPTSHAVGAAVATGMGLLSHGGVVFNFFALSLLLLIPKKFPGFLRAFVMLTTLALCMIPWTAYQKFYNPPANRLVKWHLAGITEIDQQKTGESIIGAYANLSNEQILQNKWQNVKMLVNKDFFIQTVKGLLNSEKRTDDFWPSLRHGEQAFFFNTLGWCLFGGLGALVILLKGRQEERQALKLVGILTILSLAFWCLLLFLPGSTTNHQGSYGSNLLFFSGIALCLSKLPRWATFLLLGLHISSFGILWLWKTPSQLVSGANGLTPLVHWPLVMVASLLVVAILSLLLKLYQGSQEALETTFS